MPRPVYFDTSVFLDILAKTSPNKESIFALLRELSQQKIAIYTSILTIQEVSVLTYRRGHIPHDNHAMVNRMAKIWTLDRQIALTTAKREAEICDLFKGSGADDEMKTRRKWDCFHIATAQVRECSHLYTTDKGMIKRKEQLNIPDLQILKPEPSTGTFNFSPVGPVLVSKSPPQP